MGAALPAVTGQGRISDAAVAGLALVLIVLPVLAGLAETARAAFGILPGLGQHAQVPDPWRQLAAMPGLATSLRLTLTTGIAATALSLALAAATCIMLHARLAPRAWARLLAPFLSVPHAALAIGLAFLIAPSGWVARALAPLAGWDRPPGIATVNDTLGLALTAGLVLKETPFLILALLTALSRLPVRQDLASARALGYPRAAAWATVILPQCWPMIRLPALIVLAYGLSAVEMGVILGPSSPPVLAVAITRWFLSPDPAMISPASAAALLLAALVASAIAAVLATEAALARLGRSALSRGLRIRFAGTTAATLAIVAAAGALAAALALAALAVWSVAERWSFPAPLPAALSLRFWSGAAPALDAPLRNTLALAALTTLPSLALVIAWLQTAGRTRAGRRAEILLLLPLLVPQIAFTQGLGTAFLRGGLPPGLAPVAWAQALTVFPYLLLALSGPWRALDPRITASAAALGAGPLRRLFAVRLPILLRPVLAATAIGIAVSVAQYLPTLFIGAGRVPTLTTEAVTLSSGSDRRVLAVFAMMQAILPLAAYAGALVLPAILRHNRQGLAEGAPG
jgi:putative thiamine transport system permease protein